MAKKYGDVPIHLMFHIVFPKNIWEVYTIFS